VDELEDGAEVGFGLSVGCETGVKKVGLAYGLIRRNR